jgi:hypothetical protein
MYRIKARAEIYSKRKKRVRGQERPFLTAKQLLFCFKGLFYREIKNLEFGHFNQVLHLLAYIGPRSGLWYVNPLIRDYLRG